MCCKKATTYKGKGKRLEKRSTMVSNIKISSSISLKYAQIVRKTVRDLRNNNSKAIDIHHDQGIRNLVESPWKCIVCLAKQQQVMLITSTIYSLQY